MKVSMKDLHLSCSEDMGPLNNINILSFQDNKEDLVRSFHSLPNPPYNIFSHISVSKFSTMVVCRLNWILSHSSYYTLRNIIQVWGHCFQTSKLLLWPWVWPTFYQWNTRCSICSFLYLWWDGEIVNQNYY